MSQSRVRRALAAVVLLSSIATVTSQAQVAPTELRGVVLVGDSVRVRDATVSLTPGRATLRTDARGEFSFPGIAPGRYRMVVRRLGLLPDTSRVDVGANTVVTVLVRLQPPVLERVTASAVRGGLRKVADRERRGLGAVMYADEIEDSPLFGAVDLLNFSPRFLIGNRTGVRYPEKVYIDGREMRDSADIPDKRDIAAIEAHRGYLGLRDDTDIWIPHTEKPLSSARIVLIWTKQFMERKQRRKF